MKALSVIIVNYNGQKFLKRLFDTIGTQTFSDFEMIFVDNASTDASVDFVKSNYPEVQIILSENKGYGSACNIGAKKAQGEYLVFLNEDMYLPSDFLEKMLNFRENIAKSDSRIAAIGCKFVNFDSDPKNVPDKYGCQIDIFGFPVDKHNKKDVFMISGSPFFISNSLFKAAGGFNENIFLYGEDIDIVWRLKIFGYNCYINNDAHFFHYGGGVTGGFGPEKIANNLFCSLVPLYTNYSLAFLITIIPFYIIYISLISLVLLFVKKFDLRYNYELYKKYVGFFKNIKKIQGFRRFVQKKRVRSDIFMLRYISIIPAFIYNSSYKKLAKNYQITN